MDVADDVNEPNYDGWSSIESWPLACAYDLIAAHMTHGVNLLKKTFDENRNLVCEMAEMGIRSKEIKCEKYKWDSPSPDHEYSYMNSMVNKDNFLRFIKNKGLPVHDTLWSSVKPEKEKERKLRPEQESKLICQGIAIALWEMYPEMSGVDIANHEILLTKGKGNMYTEKTRCGWVSEVDPRLPEKKTGPKRQQ